MESVTGQLSPHANPLGLTPIIPFFFINLRPATGLVGIIVLFVFEYLYLYTDDGVFIILGRPAMLPNMDV